MAYQTDKVHYTEAGKWNPLRILALLGIMALIVALTGFGLSRLKKPESEIVPDTNTNAGSGNMSDTNVGSGNTSGTNAGSGNTSDTNLGSGNTPDTNAESVNVPDTGKLPDAAESEKESWFSRLVRPRPKAEKLLSEMSIRDKVYQLFIVFPDQLTGKPPVTEAGEDVQNGLDRYPVGGILFDRDNIQSRAQICNLLAQMQSYSRIPLLMTCDEEGGRVNRLMKTVGTPYVGPMLSYRDKGEATAKANAVTIAGGLTSCGFNMDFAPVADVWSNPANSVIGNRAYSTDFDEAAALVRAAVEGFHAGGVACTLKHFPGHGDTYEDSHNGLAKVYRTWNQLEEAELKPFRAGIAAGADAVMVGHLIVGEIDSDPATISRVIVTDMLREELGFEGVIITDSLQMEAITEHYSAGEVALRAMEAGVDVLLAPNNLGEAADALLSAVEDGRLSESRIDESVMRVLNLKESYGILK